MDWFSLIPMALSGLGGILGGGKTTTSSTPTLSPQVQKLADSALDKAKHIWKQPYKAYGGDRTANPTASRAALNPVMDQLGKSAMAGMSGANGYQGRISDLMNRGPARISAPNLVPVGGPAVGMDPMAGVAPVPGRAY